MRRPLLVPRCRRAGHRVENALHTRPHALLLGTATRARRRPGGTGKVEQVLTLGPVELEASSERVEDALRHAAQVAASIFVS
jgi:hypothetical protein